MKLKAFGLRVARSRKIVAVTSQKAAAKAMGVSLYFFQAYGCETGNKEEIDLAMSSIGDVFEQSHKPGSPWVNIGKKS